MTPPDNAGLASEPIQSMAGLTTEDLLAAIPDQIDPIPRSFSFWMRVGICFVVQILLAVIYVLLVVVLSYGVWSHFASTRLVERVHALLPEFGAYFLFCCLGPLLCVLLLKPLFGLRLRQDGGLRLDRSTEPRLFAFVDRLCQAQGVPTPREIRVDLQVNASASLRHGLLGLFRDDLTLRIGLPLALCLNLREFTGVLTHELGHFAQGSAMRLTSVLHRSIALMLRIAYGNDDLVEMLCEVGALRLFLDPRLLVMSLLWSLLIWSILGLLWLARLLLKGLAWVGMISTRSLLREMEYEADRHQARIVGCETFIETGNRLLVLQEAELAANALTQRLYCIHQLPDNLPKLVEGLEARILSVPNAVQQVREQALALPVRWSDTHPSLLEREASVLNGGDKGSFCVDAPASLLFSDLPTLTREASLAVYRDEFGAMEFPVIRYRPVAELLDELTIAAGPAQTRPPADPWMRGRS